MKLGIRILLTLSLLAAACARGVQAQTARGAARADTPPRPFLSPCRAADFKTKAWCGSYEVYEDRASKRGRKISLNMVVLPAFAEKPAPDPIFFFAGGPGQGSASVAGPVGEGPLARLRQERDLVFIDQRGTGASNPLTCGIFADDNDLRAYLEDVFPVRQVRECRERLEKVADLKLYTTSIAVEDLDEVRRALGYEKVNLYGGSYGTTVALVYLRRYREHVRSAILAGVAPPNHKLPIPFAGGAQHAMNRLVADCADDAACRAAFPNLREEFRAVLDRLQRAPASVELTNPFTGKPQRVRLARGPFTERLRLMLYSRNAASMVPLLIHRAYQGDFRPFLLAALPQARNLQRSISLGLYFTVTCSESVPFITEEEVSRETDGTFIGDYRVRVHQRACREWARADVPSRFTNAVSSDAPVLLLSGEADPASPHWLGAEAARHLPNGLQLTILSGAHDYFSDCIGDITAEFLSRGSARGLNTICISAVRRPPFVTTLPPALSPTQ
ncbi:MAG TPA: alpha/beta hydrolase [Pyrinomonadaceae bacterium]|nr:alpha/beta hydrolase [Pyrinomonadaceae bacterium]